MSLVSKHTSKKFKLWMTAGLAGGMLFTATAVQAAADDGGPAIQLGAQEVGEPVTAVSRDIDVRDLPVVRPWRPGDAIREVPRRYYRPVNQALAAAPPWLQTDADTLDDRQDKIIPPSGSTRAFNAPGVNVGGIGSTGVNPPDVTGDVGASHYIQAINGSGGAVFNIYDKAGVKLSGPTAMDSLAPVGNACAAGAGDPIILYDRLASRWFMLEFTDGSNNLCIYVSKTSNPVTGGWWFYRFLANAYPDYPHCSVWSDSYVCTTNETGSGAAFYAYDRTNMLNGATARAQQRFTVTKLAGYGFQALTPATHNGATAPPAGSPVILARHNDDEAHAGAGADGTKDFIDLYSLAINWTTPTSSALTTLPRLNVTEFNSWFYNSDPAETGYSQFDTVPQPGSTSRLDPIREVIYNSLIYRNFGTYQSIVGAFATNQNSARSGTTVDAAVRWFELRKTGTAAWLLQQEGTFSPGDSSTHHFLGAIAMDQAGNIALGFNVTKTTATTVFASLKYTGRLATDAAGVMTQGETSVAAGGGSNSSGRWGDYAQMAVDPADDCTFWLTGMYQPSSSWGTKIASFKFDACGTPATTYSISGNAGSASATVSYGGAASGSVTADASGNYTISGRANGSYTVTPSKSGFTFSPVNRAVTIAGANVTAQNFTATAVPVTYSISGSAGVASATVSYSGAAAGSVTADASGNYTISGRANGSYTVTPSKTGYTFSPVNRAVTIASANVTGQNFTATPTGVVVLSKGVGAASSVNSTTQNSSWKDFSVAVPSGATNLIINTYASSGDVDLHTKFGVTPSLTVYDCRPWTGSGDETCPTIAAPAAGTYYIRVYGYALGNITFSVKADWTTGSLPVERLSNGGFESLTASTNAAADGTWSRTAFTGTSFNTLVAAGSAPRSGTDYAYLGVNAGPSSQTVEHAALTIPAAATTATLSFWTSIVTGESTTATSPYDTLSVQLIDNSTGAVLQTLTTLSNLNYTAGASSYIQRSYSVLAHKGKTVKLRLTATTDDTLATTFRVDDVSLMSD